MFLSPKASLSRRVSIVLPFYRGPTIGPQLAVMEVKPYWKQIMNMVRIFEHCLYSNAARSDVVTNIKEPLSKILFRADFP